MAVTTSPFTPFAAAPPPVVFTAEVQRSWALALPALSVPELPALSLPKLSGAAHELLLTLLVTLLTVATFLGLGYLCGISGLL